MGVAVGGVAMVDRNLKACGFTDQHTHEGVKAVAVAAPFVHQTGSHIIHPAVLPYPIGFYMLIGTEVFHVIVQNPVIQRVNLLLLGHGRLGILFHKLDDPVFRGGFSV